MKRGEAVEGRAGLKVGLEGGLIRKSRRPGRWVVVWVDGSEGTYRETDLRSLGWGWLGPRSGKVEG